MRDGGCGAGANGSVGASTGRISNGRSAVARWRNISGSCRVEAATISCSVSSVSGGGTSGIASWCSNPGSSFWNDADMLKIALPFWIATTRRVVNELPSRMRSTS